MLASVIIVTGIVGAVSFRLAYGLGGLSQGLIYGLLGLAVPVIASDMIAETFFRDDPLLTPRRVTITSFVWCLMGGLLLVAIGAAAGLTGRFDLFLRGILLTVCSSAALRAIIFSVFSTREWYRTALVIAIQPLLVGAVTYLLLPAVLGAPLSIMLAVIGLILFGPAILLARVSRWSFEDGEIRIIPLFRAFIYAWAEQHNEPLEEQLAEISVLARLETDELTFTDPFGVHLGSIVIPYVHPGPFRNVGSSGLSQIITDGINSGETIVAHGVSSHERDMARSSDMNKILQSLKETEAAKPYAVCSPVVRAEVDSAKATCQIFGETALFTLTLAPKSHDDIPSAVMNRVREAAASRGLGAIVIDAHNCLDHEDLLNDNDVENLVDSAKEALNNAMRLPREAFKAGISRVRPKEWGLKDGMGPCGIAAIVVETIAGRNAYVVFDTNNMIQGFREVILAHVHSLGYVEVEALTSDTHLVNAIGATDRGYYPAGEVMDHAKVLKYVEELLAAVKPRPAEAAFSRVAVEDVPIIGAEGIKILRDVIKTSFRVFVRTAVIALPLTFLAAAAVALFA